MNRALAIWLPVLAALALYAPTLSFERTFDDIHQVAAPGEGRPDGAAGTVSGDAPAPREAAQVVGPPESRSFAELWTRPYWGSAERGGLYRPVLSTTFWLEGRAHAPLGARHALNILLHAAVTLLLVRLLLALGLGSLPAALGGLLFALHPVHVEAVAGLVGRAELLAALWMLLALGLHDRATARLAARAAAPTARAAAPKEPAAPAALTRTATLAAAAILAFLAAGTKESAWALPFFAAALDMSRGRPLRAAWPSWIGYALGIGAHLLLRHAALGGWLNAPGVVVTPFDNPLVALHGVERVLGGLRVAGLDLVHLVFPVTLSADFSGPAVAVTGGLLDPRLWGGVTLLLGAAGVALWGGRNLELPGRAAAFNGAVWVLVSAFLVMNLLFTLGTLLADRVLYWPSAGWCAILAAIAAHSLDPARDKGAKALRLAARDPRRPVHRPRAGIVAVALLLALGTAYAIRAAMYLPAWRNDIALFEASVRAEPRAPRAWYNLGRSYQDAARVEEAVDAYRRAVDLAPDYEEAWAQLATGHMQAGRWEDAAGPLAEALRLNPQDGVARLNEGVLWLNTGRAAEARARFDEIAALEPHRVDAWYNLALAAERLGDHAQAAQAWRRAIDLDPANGAALNNLAWLLATRLGDPAQAEALARRAVALDGTNAQWLDTLAETLFRQGKRAEAVEVAQEALSAAEAAHQEALRAAPGADGAAAYREQLRRFREDAIPAGE